MTCTISKTSESNKQNNKVTFVWDFGDTLKDTEVDFLEFRTDPLATDMGICECTISTTEQNMFLDCLSNLKLNTSKLHEQVKNYVVNFLHSTYGTSVPSNDYKLNLVAAEYERNSDNTVKDNDSVVLLKFIFKYLRDPDISHMFKQSPETAAASNTEIFQNNYIPKIKFVSSDIKLIDTDSEEFKQLSPGTQEHLKMWMDLVKNADTIVENTTIGSGFEISFDAQQFTIAQPVYKSLANGENIDTELLLSIIEEKSITYGIVLSYFNHPLLETPISHYRLTCAELVSELAPKFVEIKSDNLTTILTNDYMKERAIEHCNRYDLVKVYLIKYTEFKNNTVDAPLYEIIDSNLIPINCIRGNDSSELNLAKIKAEILKFLLNNKIDLTKFI